MADGCAAGIHARGMVRGVKPGGAAGGGSALAGPRAGGGHLPAAGPVLPAERLAAGPARAVAGLAVVHQRPPGGVGGDGCRFPPKRMTGGQGRQVRDGPAQGRRCRHQPVLAGQLTRGSWRPLAPRRPVAAWCCRPGSAWSPRRSPKPSWAVRTHAHARARPEQALHMQWRPGPARPAPHHCRERHQQPIQFTQAPSYVSCITRRSGQAHAVLMSSNPEMPKQR